jgi:hypothetical protein
LGVFGLKQVWKVRTLIFFAYTMPESMILSAPFSCIITLTAAVEKKEQSAILTIADL